MHTAFLASTALANLSNVAKSFDSVSLRAAPLLEANLSQTGRREIRSRIARPGTRAVVLLMDLPTRDLTADLDRVLDAARDTLTLARELSFAMVSVDLGEVPAVVAMPPAPAADKTTLDGGALILPTSADLAKLAAPPLPVTSSDINRSAFDVAMRELTMLVERIGVTLACGATLSRQADLAATLQAIDHPLLVRELDPAAAVLELRDDVDRVINAAPAIGHVKATDARAGRTGQTSRADLGAGDVPWDALVPRLSATDFAADHRVEPTLTFAGTLDDAKLAKARLLTTSSLADQ